MSDKEEHETLDAAERPRQKEAARRADRRALKSGKMTVAELKAKNEMFAGLDVRIDIDAAEKLS